VSETLVAPTRLRVDDGRVLALDVGRWMAATDPVDEQLLDRAEGPVLDVGCGPGRHVRALHARGVTALGLEISPTAVALARRRGAPVMHRSVFDALPGHGLWRTALLLDGSVGIGGDPVALLRRVREILHPRGQVLIEVEPSHVPTESMVVRIETRLCESPWFPWARVSVEGVDDLAAEAGLRAAESWEDGGRWFSALDRAELPETPSTPPPTRQG
jgi:SAM-dependent methyltransferase